MAKWVIADIHGHRTLLQKLLTKLKLKSTDTVVFLGDYIDRGPDSRGVIDTIINLQCEKETLLGNHEDMLIKALRDGDSWLFDLWFQCGGDRTASEYGIGWRPRPDRSLWERLPDEHQEFFSNLKLYHSDKQNIYVHAGLNPQYNLSRRYPIENYVEVDGFRQERDTIIWEDIVSARIPYQESDLAVFKKTIVHGHRIQIDGPSFTRRRICLDTGIYRFNRLCAMNVKTKEIVVQY